MRRYYKEKIRVLEEAIESIKKQQRTYAQGATPDWQGYTEVDISPYALFQRIERLAEASGFKLYYMSSSPPYYTAVKIKKDVK